MLGADTRSTSGSTVADKNCEKIHYIAPNIYCCGAGTAADTENTTGARSARALARDVISRSVRSALPTAACWRSGCCGWGAREHHHNLRGAIAVRLAPCDPQPGQVPKNRGEAVRHVGRMICS